MDTILLIVTGLSLAMAGAMGALLVRMAREERRRSDARVALLEQLSVEPGDRLRAEAGAKSGSTRSNTVPGLRPARLSIGEAHVKAPAQPAAVGVNLDDLELRPGTSAAPVVEHEIFHEHEALSPWPRRLVVVGALAAVMTAVLFGWSGMQSTPVAPAGQVTAQAGEPSLELLSLQHAQQDGTLVISGLVQNPRSAAALAGIQATVLLMDPEGRAVASGRAPLDFTTLAPGDESPFVIRVPVSGAVSRYRVGFRGENDRVLGHVDRRNQEAFARKQGP